MIKEIVETITGQLAASHSFIFVTDEGEANLDYDNATFPAVVLFLERNFTLTTLSSGLVQYSYNNLQIAFINEVQIDSTADQKYLIQTAETQAANQFLNYLKERSEWQLVPGNLEQGVSLTALTEDFDDNITGVLLNFSALTLQGSNVCT
jgi:hypothetical protein